MKILDRYVLVTFLKNYLISLMVLIGLYVVLDMVFNFDELAEVQSKGAGAVESTMLLLRSIADYYFFQTFRIFAALSGIIPIVAAAFTLIRLSRFNELTASLAAGVPLLRSAMPIILAAMLLNVLLVVDQELVIPGMVSKLTRKHDQLQSSVSKAFPVRAMQDDKNGLLNAARYHPPTSEMPAFMEQVDVVQFDSAFMPTAHISADRADWDDAARQWRLTNGRIVMGLKPTDMNPTQQKHDVYKTSITPDEVSLYRSGEYIDLLATQHINQLLERPESYGKTDLQRVKHSRFTQPLLNVILLLLGVPCLLSREPGRLKVGIFQCVALVGACLAVVFLTQQLAGNPPTGAQWADRWPAVMAWLPILIFGPIAVWLLDRVKT